MLTVFLSSMLSTIFIAPTLGENPGISKVKRLKGVYWFHLMTGQYPHGVWVGKRTPEGPRYYEEKGYVALTYRNLSPEIQVIRLTTTPGANHAFWHWPEKTAYEVWLQRDTGSAWVTWWVVPDEIHLMDDLWLIGWNTGEEIHVTLEYTYYLGLPVPPEEWISVYDDYMTIMPLGP